MKSQHPHARTRHLSFRPDLILFSDAIYDALPSDGPDNGVRADPHWEFDYALKEMVSVWGMSQDTANALHKHSRIGSAGYFEEFLPTMAAHENLEVVIVPLGEWNDRSALDCCTPVNPDIYDEWYKMTECHTFSLIHPVKNSNEQVWSTSVFAELQSSSKLSQGSQASSI